MGGGRDRKKFAVIKYRSPCTVCLHIQGLRGLPCLLWNELSSNTWCCCRQQLKRSCQGLKSCFEVYMLLLKSLGATLARWSAGLGARCAASGATVEGACTAMAAIDPGAGAVTAGRGAWVGARNRARGAGAMI